MGHYSKIDIQSVLIPHLGRQLTTGVPILFTGSGFSLGAKSLKGHDIPTASGLSKLLWSIAFPDDAFDGESSLQDIYESALSAGRNSVTTLLHDYFTVQPNSIHEFQLKLLNFPWAAIYTLNIDDLIEKGLGKLGYKTESISALRSTSQLLAPAVGTRVVHLNGILEDAPDNLTFSRLQYAARKHDPFYSALVQDIRFRTVLFIGASLEEKLLWEYMVLRGSPPSGRSQRELRPRSYLVIPNLPLPKVSLLSKYNIAWYKGTTEDFYNEVGKSIEEEAEKGRGVLKRRRLDSAKPLVQLVSDLPTVKNAQSEYLFGAEPDWNDAFSGRIALRPSIDLIDKAIQNCASSRVPPNLVIVTGTAGSGKSSSMMISALKWQAEGLTSAWVARDALFDTYKLETSLSSSESLRLLFIEDADLLGGALVRLANDLAESNPGLTIVAEARSAKVDSILGTSEPHEIGAVEVVVPHLDDEDIHVLLDVLSNENRLGVLKGKSREEQERIFKRECGRQLLVAMYKATQGQEFREKVRGEFDELSPGQKTIYGILSVAHANRFYIDKGEIAIAFGDDHQAWPQDLDRLIRRKIITVRSSQLRARHRAIAQFIYENLSEDGTLADALKALIKISGSKTYPGMRRNERPARMLSRFINHNLLKNQVGFQQARQIYEEFESLLADNHHYWLHRGALELEDLNFSKARTFLSHSKGIDDSDVFVDVELAYLDLKEAVDKEARGVPSEKEIDEALATLNYISEQRQDQRSHVTHIGASQTLAWIRAADLNSSERERRMRYWITAINRINDWTLNDYLVDIERQLRRELLSLAVRSKE